MSKTFEWIVEGAVLLVLAACLVVAFNHKRVDIPQPQPQSKIEFINKVYAPATAVMYGKHGEKGKEFPLCTATAFKRTEDGFLFVSAAHCVNDVPKDGIVLLGDDQPDGKRFVAEVVAYGDERDRFDFSVLKITAPSDAFTVMPLGNNPSQIGEPIFSISSPGGVGRSYIAGYIAMTDIPKPTPVGDGVDWQHNILNFQGNEGPGSSGGTIVCENQMKVCAIVIGHTTGGQIAEPIERFVFWYNGVIAGNIPMKVAAPESSE
jgi:hypothetical protein